MKKRTVMIVAVCMLIAATAALVQRMDRQAEDHNIPEMVSPKISESEDIERNDIRMKFYKRTSGMIELQWAFEEEDYSCYHIMRKTVSEDADDAAWQEVGTIWSDALEKNKKYIFQDILPTDSPQQYVYRIDTERGDGKLKEGEELLASNVSVCIDPGHYKNSSELQCRNSFGYDEGMNMLEVGLLLRDILRDEYGISSHLTRETDDITIDGYTNGELDNYHISLRGESASGDDLFVSLHSNSNLENANGCMTDEQPVTINKTLIFLNQKAQKSERAFVIGNAIGTALTAANDAHGLLSGGGFTEVSERSGLRLWDDEYNDSLHEKGTICYRDGDNGEDYYGVLRGANRVGVIGILIEHGHHSVEEVRRLCRNSDLNEQWAEADAKGIAEGFLFRSKQSV